MKSDIQQELHLRTGDVVRVRPFREILQTLNDQSSLDLLPFMPEMLEYCGKTFRVYKRAEKTCVELAGIRGMRNAVFLENVRCSGASHHGCQRACLIFWKEAWLERVSEGDQTPAKVANDDSGIRLKTKVDAETYFCQSTELSRATYDLPWWKISQYVNDYRFGQVSIRHVIRTLAIVLYNKVQRTFGRPEYGMLRGTLTKTPDASLNLRAGEVIEVKSKEEIAATLNETGRNKGMEFSPEMHTFCGKQFHVVLPMDRIILEATGKMQRIQNTVLLDNTNCDGSSHRGCPRNNCFMWKEIWLKRVP